MQGVQSEVGTGCGGIPPFSINSKIVTTSPPVNPRQLGTLSKTDLSAKWTGEEEKKKKAEKAKAGRRLRYWLSLRQRQEVISAGLWDEFKSLCGCGRYPVPAQVKTKDGQKVATGSPGRVQLSWYAGKDSSKESPFAFTWVRRCSSAMLCFVDAPVVRWHRSREVQRICEKMIVDDYSVQFWTFTAPHDLSTDPVVQRNAFQRAMRRMRQGRVWTLFAKKWGLEHHIRAVEMTDDAPGAKNKSGCHFHYHLIVFCKHSLFTEEEAEEMRAFISARWVRFLVEEGFIENTEEKKAHALRFGFMLKLPRKPKNKDFIISELASYVAKGASFEMTPGILVKDGRLPARVSHWELMMLALTRFPDYVPRMLDVMRALKGVHWLHFSPGLREMCGVDVVSDEEIVQKRDAPSLAVFSQENWEKIDNVKFQRRFIDSVVRKCREFGFNLDEIPLNKAGKIDNKNEDVEGIKWMILHVFGEIDAGFDPDTGEVLKDAIKSPPPEI